MLTINNSDKSHDHLVKGQTVKVRKTSSFFFLLLADILSDAIFQVIEQRGTSLLIDKALTYKFFCVCLLAYKPEFGLVLRGKFDTLFLQTT